MIANRSEHHFRDRWHTAIGRNSPPGPLVVCQYSGLARANIQRTEVSHEKENTEKHGVPTNDTREVGERMSATCGCNSQFHTSSGGFLSTDALGRVQINVNPSLTIKGSIDPH